MIVEINAVPYIVKQVQSKSPSSRGAATLYKVRFNNLQTQQKLDESYKGDDFLKEADCVRAGVQFSYIDDDIYYFMNSEDYSQYGLNVENLEGQTGYLVEQLEGITALIMEGVLLGVELPQSVVIDIVDTPPGVSGASATGRTKLATLSTGLEVQVPEYLNPGESIKVNTTTGKFISRA